MFDGPSTVPPRWNGPGIVLDLSAIPIDSDPSRSEGRLVLALDADEAGQRGANRLQALLAERRPDIARVTPPAHANDLNAWMLRSGVDWPAQLTSEIRLAIHGTKARSLAR